MTPLIALLPLLACLPKLDPSAGDTGEASVQTEGGGTDGGTTGDSSTSDSADGGTTDGGTTDGGTTDTAPVGTDADGDGFISQEDGGADCDDASSAVNPEAIEVCDGVDNNCDGITDGEDAEDAGDWYLDDDRDGYGVDGVTTRSCEQPEGYAGSDGDCDDTDPAYNPGAIEDDCTDPNDYNCDGSTGYADGDGDGWAACEDCDDADGDTYPGAVELCDAVDNNCDGDIDEDGAADASTWYRDSDEDGYGDEASTLEACERPEGYADRALDCNDGDAAINPDAEELCDEVDNNCDEVIDTDALDRSTWYPDSDEDGYGDPSLEELSCEAPAGWVANSSDCDDGDATIKPGADEYCDAVDEDCDALVDEEAVDQETWYYDDDGDGFGDSALTAEACEAPADYVLESGDCDDDDWEVNPGAVEVCEDGVDNDCDGAATGCGPSGGVGAGDAELILYGANASDDAGYAVSGAGDVNGDGYGDLLVGAKNQTVTAESSGAAYIVYGPASGSLVLDSTTATQLGGEDKDHEAGRVVMGPGDMDGDGYDDVLVGSSLVEVSGRDGFGAVYLYRGSAAAGVGAVLLADADARIYGSLPGDYAASAVAAGDLDGDGVPDLIVGADGRDDPASQCGAVYLVSGPLSGDYDLDTDAAAILTGIGSDDRAGVGAATADVDGDGIDDLLAGATGESAGGSDAGGVYVVLGPISSGMSFSDADALITGAHNNDQIGAAIAAADADGDGLAEILIGAEEYDVTGTNDIGMAYLMGYTAGASSVVAADLSVEGSYADALLGASVAFAGDLDGDGYPELLLGSPGADEGANGAGTAYLFYGPVTGSYEAHSDADLLLEGQAKNDALGASVAGAGDIDGDGFDDIIAGAPREDTEASGAGAAYLLLGGGL